MMKAKGMIQCPSQQMAEDVCEQVVTELWARTAFVTRVPAIPGWQKERWYACWGRESNKIESVVSTWTSEGVTG